MKRNVLVEGEEIGGCTEVVWAQRSGSTNMLGYDKSP